MSATESIQTADGANPVHPRGTAETQVADFRNEAPLDFSSRSNREAFESALGAVRRRFPIHAPLVIDGRFVETASRETIRSPNDTSLTVGTCASAGAEEVAWAVESAESAFAGWSATPAKERANVLREAARHCRKHRLELAAIEVFESAKPWREADADVCEAIDFLEYYSRRMEELAAGRRLQPEIPGERNELLYFPRGVVAVIGPWNFPLAIPVGMTSAALVAGNTVVWKPAEQSPLIIHRMMELFMESGLPPGVVNYLPGRGETAGRMLAESPGVNMIAFTGSRAVGLGLIKTAARVPQGQGFVKRVSAEMGGKNAIVVDATADLDAAVPDIVDSAFGFSGQKCSACSRLILVDPVGDEILKRLRDAVGSLTIAPAWDPGCQLGPVIDEEAVERVESYRRIGRTEGRVLIETDPGSLAERGRFVGAGVYEVDSPHCRLAQEEIFGPVLAVLRVADFETALDFANSTDYALTGGVFSRTPRHLELARKRFECGNLYLNRSITGAIVGRQPFGGFRLSGVGLKAGGPDYLLQFLEARAISENLTRQGSAPLESPTWD